MAGPYKVVVLGRRDWIRVDALPLREGETHVVGAVAYTEQHVYRTQLVLHHARGEAAPWLLVCSEACAPRAVREYRVRMWTEEFYGDLKGHGFGLEATHLDDAGRLSRLVLAVFLVYVWLMAVGIDVVKRGLRPLVDRRSRRDKSYFRVGWDYLEHRLRLGEPIPIRFEPHP